MFSDALHLGTERYFLNKPTEDIINTKMCVLGVRAIALFPDSLLLALRRSPCIPGCLAESGFCLLSWLNYEDIPFHSSENPSLEDK